MAPRAKKEKKEPVDLVALIDEYGRLKTEMETLDERIAPLAKTLKELVSGRADGKNWWVDVSQAERTSLDTKAIKAEMPQSWVDRFSRTSKVTTLNWGKT